MQPPGGPSTGLQPHIAKGTFSLPVQLPATGIRLDFARPGGQARLTIWAVRTSAIRDLVRTVALVVVFAGLFFLYTLLLKKGIALAPISLLRVVGYAVLALLLLAILGCLGLVPWLLIVILVEVVCKRSGSKPARPTAN